MVKALPKKIIPLKNKDKEDHEHWYKGRDLMDFPAPFCMYICGIRNCGKSTLIKNILARSSFDSGMLYHFDGANTLEYDDSDLEIIDSIPPNSEIEKEGKKVLIIEDIPYDTLSQDEKINLQGLLKYCTHKNLSIIVTGHDFSTSFPAQVRRLFNIFILYKVPDVSSLGSIGTKVGIKNSDFIDLFKLCESDHDNICIDLTKSSPAPLRFNIYKKISYD